MENTHTILNFTTDGEKSALYISIRPYAREFIIYLSSFYDIYFFTASGADYAQILSKILDPNQLIKKIYSREHCTLIEGNKSVLYKDLTVITHNLKDIILIDNSPNCI